MQDQLTRHQIWLQRYAGGLYKNDVLPILEEVRDRIMYRLSYPTLNDLQNTKRLAIILSDIEIIIQNGIGKIKPELWKELAEYENEYNVKLLDDATVPSVVIGTGLNPTALTAITATSTVQMAGQEAMTIDDMVKVLSDRHYKDIKNEIQIGIASGNTLNEITKMVKDLSDTRSRQQAESVVRTVTNHVSNSVRMETYKGYDHLFKGVQWVSTLDSRTSPICMSRDGKLYPLSKHPSPPAHYNCRSVLVHVVKDEYDIMKGTGSRSTSDGYMPAEATYNDWLKRQSNAVQNEILGKARAEAYRKSGESIDRFIDRKGQFYSLDDLKKADKLGKVAKTAPIIDLKTISDNETFNSNFANIQDERIIKIVNSMPSLNKKYDSEVFKNNNFALVTGGRSSNYDMFNRNLSISQKDISDRSTVLHEYGHFIDNTLMVVSKYDKYPTAEILTSMNEDIKILALNSKTKQGKEQILSIFNSIDGANNHQKSDILDAFVSGHIFDNGIGAGHGKKYYKGLGQTGAETFANLFALKARGVDIEDLRQYFPNTIDKFEEILTEASGAEQIIKR